MSFKETVTNIFNYARHHVFGTCVVGAIIWLAFLSEHSMWSIHKLNRQKAQMQDQITKFRESIEKYEESIDEVSGDNDEMEHFAREKLLMKRPNEDIYLIED